MLIVAHLGDNVNEYLELFDARLPGLDRACPNCREANLWRHGSYQRWAVGSGRVWRLPIQRFRCPHCGITVSLLPDIVAPYGRYLLRVRVGAISLRWKRGWAYDRITGALSHATTGLCPETVRGWVRRSDVMLEFLEPWLMQELCRLSRSHPLLSLKTSLFGASVAPWFRFLICSQALRETAGSLLPGGLRLGSSPLGFLNCYLPGQGLHVWV